MSIVYREDKATQAAELLLELRDAPMSYLKLIKLLYLADRAALHKWGRPITYDHYVSMDKGPVLSATYDRITEEPRPDQATYWQAHITTKPESFEVEIAKPTDKDQLSDAERDLLCEVFEEHGHKGRWDLVEETHALPEYCDPEGSRLPISVRDILVAGGWTEEDAEEAAEELEAESAARRLWSG